MFFLFVFVCLSFIKLAQTVDVSWELLSELKVCLSLYTLYGIFLGTVLVFTILTEKDDSTGCVLV